MAACGDTAKALIQPLPSPALLTNMKLPAKEEPDWTARKAPPITGQTTHPGCVGAWGLTSEPVCGRRQGEKVQGKCQIGASHC